MHARAHALYVDTDIHIIYIPACGNADAKACPHAYRQTDGYTDRRMHKFKPSERERERARE